MHAEKACGPIGGGANLVGGFVWGTMEDKHIVLDQAWYGVRPIAFLATEEEMHLQGCGGKERQMHITEAPFQIFRWVHFPRDAELVGEFLYRVTPMFMDASDKLTPGEAQSVAIQLARETYPGIANVTFTRGFVSSQAFVDNYGKDGDKQPYLLLPIIPPKKARRH